MIRKSDNLLPVDHSPSILKVRKEYGRFEAEDIFALIRSTPPQVGCITIDRMQEKLRNIGLRRAHRMYERQPNCAFCGLEGTLFIAETLAGAAKKVLLNMYGERDGMLLMFNVDHVVPQSLGGGNDDKNRQSSCCRCNSFKGNICTDPFAAARLRRQGIID